MTIDIASASIFRPGNTLYVRPTGENEWREMIYRGINGPWLVFDDETETPLSVGPGQVKGIPITRAFLQSRFEIFKEAGTAAEQFRKGTAAVLIDPDDFQFIFLYRGQRVAALQYVHELENLLKNYSDAN
jgi:hypothetical protein